MAQLILVRAAKQLLTLRGPGGVRRGSALDDLGIIEDGSVLIRDGVVAAVGTTRRIENLKQAREAFEIPADGRLVMPGFVDAGINLSLDAESDLSGPARNRKKVAAFQEESRTLLQSCLHHGTLTAEVKAISDGSGPSSVIPLFRQLDKITGNPISVVRTWRISPLPYFDDVLPGAFEETLALMARRKLIQFIEVATASGNDMGERLLAAAGERGFGLKLLWHGGTAETLEHLLTRFHPRTVRCSSHLSSVECSVLAQAQPTIVFAPACELLEEPAGDSARRAIDAGAGIALATEYDPKHAVSSSMQMVLSLAVLRLHMTPEQAISAATINAAHAVGHGARTGSLELGKQADVVILNVPDYRELHRQFGVNHVDMALRGGVVVFNRSRWKVSGI